jgi:lipopolysaccharide biosynthesis protein
MSTANCSVFFHNYYGDHAAWVRLFAEKIRVPFNLYYNVVEDSVYTIGDDPALANQLREVVSGSQLKRIVLRRSPNLGKDIGGKLVLVDACLHEATQAPFSVFLHDKKSPYKAQGQEWKDRLFGIIEPSFIEKALSSFAQKDDLGIIAGTADIRDEYDHSLRDFISNNRSQLKHLQTALNINITDYRYVAGTMFWVRSSPLLDFFRKYHPLDIRKSLERGNIMDETSGTSTHAWERMLSWLIFAQGYTIKGL